jgi:hypothetical protein
VQRQTVRKVQKSPIMIYFTSLDVLFRLIFGSGPQFKANILRFRLTLENHDEFSHSLASGYAVTTPQNDDTMNQGAR